MGLLECDAPQHDTSVDDHNDSANCAGGCANGGQCVPDGGGGHSCRCREGFGGRDCSRKQKSKRKRKNKDHSRSSVCSEERPCAHGGVCVEAKGGVARCRCPEGRVGKRCEKKG